VEIVEIRYTTKNCQDIQQLLILCSYAYFITLLLYTLFCTYFYILIFIFVSKFIHFSVVFSKYFIGNKYNFKLQTISAKIFKRKKTWLQNFKNEKFEKRAFNIISIILKLIAFSHTRHRYFTYSTTNGNKQKTLVIPRSFLVTSSSIIVTSHSNWLSGDSVRSKHSWQPAGLVWTDRFFIFDQQEEITQENDIEVNVWTPELYLLKLRRDRRSKILRSRDCAK